MDDPEEHGSDSNVKTTFFSDSENEATVEFSKQQAEDLAGMFGVDPMTAIDMYGKAQLIMMKDMPRRRRWHALMAIGVPAPSIARMFRFLQQADDPQA